MKYVNIFLLIFFFTNVFSQECEIIDSSFVPHTLGFSNFKLKSNDDLVFSRSNYLYEYEMGERVRERSFATTGNVKFQIDRNDNIWILYADTLLFETPDTTIQFIDSLDLINGVGSMLVDSQNRLLMAIDSGLVIIDSFNMSFMPFPQKIVSMCNNNNSTYLATISGEIYYRKNNDDFTLIADVGERVQTMYLQDNGVLLVVSATTSLAGTLVLLTANFYEIDQSGITSTQNILDEEYISWYQPNFEFYECYEEGALLALKLDFMISVGHSWVYKNENLVFEPGIVNDAVGTVDMINVFDGNIIYTLDYDHNSEIDYLKIWNYDICSKPSTKVNESYLQTKVRAYPNPSDGLLRIESDFAIESIQIFDLNGNQVRTVQNSDFLNLTSIENGFYILKLLGNRRIASKKIQVIK